jgi:hypothetical protein
MIFPYVLLRLLKEVYGQEGVDFITQEEMDTAVGEILPLLQNFGWLVGSDLSLSKKRFREADLFTVVSNGDAHLDLSEAVRYMAFITSALRSAEVWLSAADTHCRGRNPSCVRDLAFDSRADVLAPLPRLQALLKSWGRERFLSYMQNGETIILGHPAEGSYGVGELLQVWQIFEYAEAFMQRFDADASETITRDEALRAYPYYGPTINEMFAGGAAPDDTVLALFTFLLKYGNTPDQLFGGHVLFLNWQLRKDSWRLDVERGTLMAILAELSRH